MGLRGIELLEELEKRNKNKKPNSQNNIRIQTKEEDKEMLERWRKNPMAFFGAHCDYNVEIPLNESDK